MGAGVPSSHQIVIARRAAAASKARILGGDTHKVLYPLVIASKKMTRIARNSAAPNQS